MSNMTFSQGLYELMDSYDGFILDQWGVLHNGLQPYESVIDSLNHLKARKKQVVILSNSAKRADDNVERLKKLGIKPGLYKAVVTAGEVAWQGLKEKKDAPFKGLGPNCYMISRPDDRGLLSGLDAVPVENVEDAHFILINSFDAATKKLEDMDPVFKAAAAKRIPMICANPDMVTLYGHERAPGPGAVAARYNELGGAVHYIGKPHKTIFRYCLTLFDDVIPSRILVIGDSIQHDIAGGASADLDTAFITAGIHAAAFKPGMLPGQKRKMMEQLALGYGGIRPTWVLDGLVWQTPEAALRERERARMKE
ncbi:MAG: TIGR01459 family HAD-type hydrolase [Alphaproteobacteria bacterium]|nr:TIGR01459 family HAD-type hydrolase [Alphaproteobacteria bacterium]MDE2336543.1 TIGR01459 family HAD-type hydrolase [Alphaproteobacteria bacterium]